ncbi:MAG TPA: metallophosphoesterase [Candidatus Moranbacteria bacterium]|nr:metallophosphoesterase [Candidatus Moranbacteria bacterium]
MKKILHKLLAFFKKNKKIIILIILLAIAGGIYYKFIYLAKPDIENKKSLNVAIVTDIHVGPEKKGHSESAVVYPKEYRNNLKPLMDSRPDLIITLGDNVNDDNKCHPYADNLIKLLSRFNVLWAKGNHDKECFKTFSDVDYYYHDYDKAGWRIVMLDHDIDIDLDELNWLKNSLKTDNKVLIVTHIPFFSPSRDENALLPQYTEAEKVISGAGNVKYVFMGHLHSRLWDKVYNGVHYYILPSVSGSEYPQYFMKLTLN